MDSNTVESDTVRFGFAWLLLCIALALHVLDEALTNFLSVYNPIAVAIRKRAPFLPLPVFSFRVWLGGLCIAIVLAFAYTPIAFHAGKCSLLIAQVLSVFMTANAMGHLAMSLYRRRPMPGVYSSPVLLLASIYLFLCARSVDAAAH